VSILSIKEKWYCRDREFQQSVISFPYAAVCLLVFTVVRGWGMVAGGVAAGGGSPVGPLSLSLIAEAIVGL